MPEQPIRQFGQMDIYPGDVYKTRGGAGNFNSMSPGMIEMYDLMFNQPQFFQMLMKSLGMGGGGGPMTSLSSPAPAVMQPPMQTMPATPTAPASPASDDELIRQDMERRRLFSFGGA